MTKPNQMANVGPEPGGPSRRQELRADIIDVATARVRRDDRRRSSELPETGAATSSFAEAALALAVARQQLNDARRQIECLRIANERLTGQLLEVARRGTEAHSLAYQDDLTGLPNRLLLRKRLQHEIEQARQWHRQLALLFIDLDGFKAVNDSCGHVVGDKLLTAVAARILNGIRASDIACRYGGDEFVVLLADVDSMTPAIEIAEKIRAHIGECYVIDGREFSVTASIGVAAYPFDGEHCDALIAHADASMYRSKAARLSANTRATPAAIPPAPQRVEA